MAYTNSPLVNYTKLSPNNSGYRTHSIDRITPHCVVGQCSVERLGEIFAPVARQASSNYGIGPDGRVGMYCEEKNRSWCSSSNANDQRAVTIECASDTSYPYAIRDACYSKLILLCADICKRNGKKKLLWLKDKTVSLNYEPKPNEMMITLHRWFSNTICPGQDIIDRLPDLVKQVNKLLGSQDPEPTPEPKEECEVKLPVLKRTNTGNTVKDLQILLNYWCQNQKPLYVDGDFGALTEERVKYYQTKRIDQGSEYITVVDGIVGEQTWSDLLLV